jgi:hypothetical protein
MGDAGAVTGPTDRFELPDDTPTARLPVITVPAEPGPIVAVRSGFWRELSGSLTVGLCLLALIVVALQGVAWSKGMPGPGVPVVLGHLVAGIVAVVSQRTADRRRGYRAALPAVLVATTTTATLWFFWWS